MGSPRHHRLQDESGAIAIMAAVLATAMVLAGALAVDVGRVAYVSRDQQGATDRAALDSAQTLRAVDNQASVAAVEETYAEALASTERNPMPGTQQERTLYRVDLGVATDPDATGFELVCGAYFDADGNITDRDHLVGEGILAALSDPDVDPDSAAAQQAPDDCVSHEGAVVDAIRIWTFGGVDYVLALGESGTTMHKLASARAVMPDPDCPESDPECEEAEATFQAGSTLASMEGGVLNDWLSEVFDDEESGIDMDLVGYQGMADTRIRLGDLVATDALTVGSVDELLYGGPISVLDLIEATAEALPAEGEAATAGLVADLYTLAGLDLAVGVEQIHLGHEVEDDDEERVGGFALDTPEGRGADARVDAVDLVFTALQIATRDAGVQLQLNALGDTVSVTTTVVRPPVVRVGTLGTEAETAQVAVEFDLALEDLRVEEHELGEELDSALNTLSGTVDGLTGTVSDLTCSLLGGLLCIGTPSVDLALDDVTVTAGAAEGTSTLIDLQCAEPGQLTLDTLVRSGSISLGGDLLAIDDEHVQFGGGIGLGVGDSDGNISEFERPYPSETHRVPEGGSPLTTSVDLGGLVGEGSLDDDEFLGELLDELTDPTDGLLEPLDEVFDVALLGEDGMLQEVLEQLGLGLTTVDVKAHDLDCTGRTLQPSVSDN